MFNDLLSVHRRSFTKLRRHPQTDRVHLIDLKPITPPALRRQISKNSANCCIVPVQPSRIDEWNAVKKSR